MTNIELVRFKIDDHKVEAYEEVISDGATFLYELDYHPVEDVVVKYNDTVKTLDTDYIQNVRMGQIKLIGGNPPIGTPQAAGVAIKVEYNHAAFLDSDIQQLLDDNGQSTIKASIAAVRILLASSARRFDYQQGHTRMSPSQVFDHLKSLLETLEKEAAGGSGADFSIGDRSNDAWDDGNNEIENDLSRNDGDQIANLWSRDI